MYHKYKNVERVKPSGLELVDRLVGVQRVTKVTKGGRAFGFSAIVVVGDGNGVVGHGLGKSKDVSSAIAKAIEDAKKNLVKIPILNGTLPHESIYQTSIQWYRSYCRGSSSCCIRGRWDS
jgi:small subunit ribosomal protein S5